jgi:hypothetical protein
MISNKDCKNNESSQDKVPECMDVRHRLTTYTPTCNPRHMQALKVSTELKDKDVVPGTYTSTDTSTKDTSAHIDCEVLDNQTITRPLTLSVASAASITIPSSVDPPDLVKPADQPPEKHP